MYAARHFAQSALSVAICAGWSRRFHDVASECIEAEVNKFARIVSGIEHEDIKHHSHFNSSSFVRFAWNHEVNMVMLIVSYPHVALHKLDVRLYVAAALGGE